MVNSQLRAAAVATMTAYQTSWLCAGVLCCDRWGCSTARLSHQVKLACTSHMLLRHIP